MSEESGNKAEHGSRSGLLENITKGAYGRERRAEQQQRANGVQFVRGHREARREEPKVHKAHKQEVKPVESKEVKYVYKGFCKDIRFNGFFEVREAMDIFMESEGANIFVEVQTQSSKICLKNDAGDEVKMTITGRVIVVE